MSPVNAKSASRTPRRKVVVIGAGFAGMAVVRALRDSDADVTLVDRANHHLFQPFLFQVATAILEPAEIATPIRSLTAKMPNVRVEMREAKRVDVARRVVVMGEGGDLPYDFLVVATGAQTSHFGHEADWKAHALGLKTISDAVGARNRLLRSFERAEMEPDPARQARDMTVVVVGGGPTGVAITGTISEFVHRTLSADFRNIDVRRARIVLVHNGPRILPAFSERHSLYATRALERAGIEVRLGAPVTRVDADGVVIGQDRIAAATVLWCAGVRGAPLAATLGAEMSPSGTVLVERDYSVPGHPECFVVGDAACVLAADGRPLPGLASVAKQQGRHVGKHIAARLKRRAAPRTPKPFSPSKLATITRHVGVAEFGGRSITGFAAWLMWGLMHLRDLADGHAKLSILANWLRLLTTYRRSARLIIEHHEPPTVAHSGLHPVDGDTRPGGDARDLVVERQRVRAANSGRSP
jgi:NADH dehydrogenase